MNVDILRSVKTVVTHNRCADGLASALIVKDALPDAEVKFLDYNSPEHRALTALAWADSEDVRGTLFVDFTPWVERGDHGWLTPRGIEQARAWVDAGAIVLDHHAGVAGIVSMFGDRGVYSDESGVSGAVLAYREVWQACHSECHSRREAVWAFADLAGIYDTWQKTHPDFYAARAQAEALLFWPRETLLDDGLHHTISHHLDIGPILLQKNAERDARVIAEAHRFTVEGLKVACFEGTHVNEVAETLWNTEQVDLVMGWHYYVEAGVPKMKVSCRTSEKFDAMAFAQFHGGNGHKRAAGFVMEVDGTGALMSPYSLLHDKVVNYLHSAGRAR